MLTHELPYKIESTQIIGYFVALLISFFLTPLIRERAVKLGLLDVPSERRVHKVPTPRLGGVAIFISLFLTSLILTALYATQNKDAVNNFPILGVLAGGTIIFILGLMDDLESINPFKKLFFQFLAASVAWILGVKIMHIVNPLYHADFYFMKLSIGDRLIHFSPLVSFILTNLWIIGITNAVNLVDGLDGLATGVSIISALAIWSVSLGQKIDQPVGALFAATLAGSLLGFLRWNFNPARIFLGDSGAYLTGFVLSSLTITCVMKSVTLAIMAPMLIMIFFIPITDTILAFTRRLLRKQSPLSPDKEHLHHKLLESGFDQKRTVYIFYLISALFGFLATYLMSIQSCCRFLILIALSTSLILFFTFIINWKRQKIFKKPNN